MGTEGRIQEGIDTTDTNGTVWVAPSGSPYSETATSRTTAAGTNQFGLFFAETKPGVSVIGVDASDVPVTDPTATLARIQTNAVAPWGPSGIFVAADDITIQGLEIGTNAPDSNKTIEVIGDGFSFLDSYLNDVEGAIYFGDFGDATTTSRIATYHIDGNVLASDNSITIANGTGHGHPADLLDRTITDNTFVGAPNWWHISFRGQGGQGWYAYPVGGATIAGNDFGPADINIRATGIYDESEFLWDDWRDDNTFARLVWVEDQNTGNLQVFSYTTSVTYTNVRQLGGRIDSSDSTRPAGVDIAVAGDTVHVHSGTYPEQAIIDKDDITVAGYGGTKPVVDDGGTAVGVGLTISGDDVTVSNLKVQGYFDGINLTGSGDLVGPSDSLLDGVTVTDVESVDNARHGLLASATAGLSNIDDRRR